MKRGILVLSLFLAGVLVISGCAKMSPRQIPSLQEGPDANDPNCEEEYYPEDHNHYPGEPCKLGDINRDGGWNVLDIGVIAYYFDSDADGWYWVNKEHPIHGKLGCQADMNFDQVIDEKDGAILRICILADNCDEYIESLHLQQD